jgi:RHS repeat-associated protein
MVESGYSNHVPTNPYYVWGAQLEEQAFPTSYIPTTTTAVTRVADQLLYTAAQVPEWVRTGTFQLDAAPMFSSSEMKLNQLYRLFSFENGDGLSLVRDATGSYARLRSGGVDTSFPITWTRYQRLTFTLARATNQFTVEGALTGNGSFAGAGAFASSAMRVGGAYAGADEAFAAISELRQVVGVVASCPVDTSSGCAQCGNGVVDAGEACDPAADPRCSGTCTSAGIAICSRNDQCPIGQVCGVDKGDRYGLPDFLGVCWPTTCETNAAANCGTVDSMCGECVCSPNCANKVCGGDLSDGCGGLCDSVCAPGEVGCERNEDCRGDYVCGIGQGPRFGRPAGTNVCWRPVCDDPNLPVGSCGTTTSLCGLCAPPPANECGAAECGEDEHGNSCGTCGLGFYCSDEQTCRTVFDIDIDLPPGAIIPAMRPEPTRVGAVPASFGVSSHGAAQYTVPLQVPPGRGGVQPSLSIQYDSNAGHGSIAQGWSLAGLSSIERCPRGAAQDGVPAKGVTLDADDSFCLDGQKLVQVSPGNGGERAAYRTLPDTFRRVSARGLWVNSSGVYVGPEWFEVQTTDGMKMIYGRNPEARVSAVTLAGSQIGFSWHLERVEDLFGNYYTVEYTSVTAGRTENLQPFPRTNIAGFTVPRPVSLHYGDRGSHEIRLAYRQVGVNDYRGFRYRAGVPTFVSIPIESVEMRVQGAVAHRYRMQTTYSDGFRLNALRLCTDYQSAEVCLPPTTFEYKEPESQVFTKVVTTSNAAGVDLQLAQPSKKRPTTALWSVELNGDSRQDILYQVKLGTGNLTDFNRVQGAVSLPDQNDETDIFQNRWTSPFEQVSAARSGDFDGDGIDDTILGALHATVAWASSEQGSLPSAFATRAYFVSSRKATFDWGVPTQPGTFFQGSGAYINAFVADVDGDRIGEIITCEVGRYDDDSVLWSYRKLTCTGEDQVVCTSVLTNLDSVHLDSCDGLVMDVDGDGSAELMAVDEHGTAFARLTPFGFRLVMGRFPFNLEKVQKHALDLNGDGLSDLIIADEDSDVMRAYFNTGDDFVLYSTSSEGIPEYFHEGFAIDTDANGRYELCIPDANLGWICHAPQVGTGWAVVLTNLPMLVNGDRHYEQGAVAADIDGDGAQEVVLRMGSIQDPVFEVWRTRKREVGLLIKVTDGIGKTTGITYGSGSELGTQSPTFGAPHYTRGGGPDCNYPARCLEFPPRPVVLAHTVTGVSGFDETTSGGATVVARRRFEYAYVDARDDLRGLGFLGFSKQFVAEVGEEFPGTPLSYSLQEYQITPVTYAGRSFPDGTPSTTVKLVPTTQDGVTLLNKSASEKTWAVRVSDAGIPFLVPRETREAQYEPLPTFAPAEVYDVDLAHAVSARVICYGHRGDDGWCAADYDVYGNAKAVFNMWLNRGHYVNSQGTVVPDFVNQGEVEERYEYVDAASPGWSTFLDNWLVRLPRTITTTGNSISADPPRRKQVRNTYLTTGKLDTTETWLAAWTPVDVGAAWVYASAPERSTRFWYTNYGNLTTLQESAREAETITHGFDYDSFGMQLTRTRKLYPEEPARETRYDVRNGKLRFARDPDGTWRSYAYDGFGYLRRQANSVGQSATTSYSASAYVGGGAVRVASSGDGVPAVRVDYNTFGMPIEKHVRSSGTNAGAVVRTSYDNRMRAIAVSAPHLLGTEAPFVELYSYDNLDRLTSEVHAYYEEDDILNEDDGHPLDAVTEHRYYTRTGTGSIGNIISWRDLEVVGDQVRHAGGFAHVVRDPSGAESATITNGRGQVRYQIDAQIDSLRTVTRLWYDSFGFVHRINLNELLQPRQVAIENDLFGQMKSIQTPGLPMESFHRDGFGRVLTHARGNHVASFRYDRSHRTVGKMTTEVGNTTATAEYEWIYDGGAVPTPSDWGKLTSEVVNSSTVGSSRTDYVYGGAGASLSEVRRTIEGELFGATLVNDSWGRPETVNYPAGSNGYSFSARYRYNAFGQLDQVRDDSNLVLWETTKVDAFGQEETVRTIGGVASHGIRQAATGLLSRIELRSENGQQIVPSESYLYDSRGLLARQDTTGAEGNFEKFIGHDALGRLEYEQVSGFVDEYRYDVYGNVTESPRTDAIQYEPVAGGERLTSTATGNEYRYDSLGNQTFRQGPDVPEGEQHILYSDFDLPLKIDFGGETPSPAPANPTPPLNPVRTTTFRYDASNNRTSQRERTPSAQGETGWDITYVGDLYRRTTELDGATEHVVSVPTPAGLEIEVVLSGPSSTNREYRIAQTNHNGSVRAVLDGDGAVSEQRSWSAFGEFSPFNGQTGTRLGFTGHENDASSGLVNMRGRMYDPVVGRFLTRDPVTHSIVDTQSWNPYAYVRNSPHNLVDPTGFDWMQDEEGGWYDPEPVVTSPVIGATEYELVPVSAPLTTGLDSYVGTAPAPSGIAPPPSGPPTSSVGSLQSNVALSGQCQQNCHGAARAAGRAPTRAEEREIIAYVPILAPFAAVDAWDDPEASGWERGVLTIGVLAPLLKWITPARAVVGGAARGVGAETKYIYRGVHAGHPQLEAARRGAAVPGNVGGVVSAEAHNLGGVSASSPFTSWTHELSVAQQHATKYGPGGVVLRTPAGAPSPGASWAWEWSPDVYMESEVLMRGVREGLEVLP